MKVSITNDLQEQIVSLPQSEQSSEQDDVCVWISAQLSGSSNDSITIAIILLTKDEESNGSSSIWWSASAMIVWSNNSSSSSSYLYERHAMILSLLMLYS